MHQGQVHRVLAGALKKILGAIQRIKDPQPFGSKALAGWQVSQLLLGRFLAEQGPIGTREGGAQAIKQPLVHRQIGR